MSTSLEGFILTEKWEDSPSHCLSYTIVSKQCVFTVKITNSKPLFFIDNVATASTSLPGMEQKDVNLQTLGKRPVKALYFKDQRDLQNGKEQLRTQGVRTFESDVRPSERYLMERFIFGGVKVTGQMTEKNGCIEFVNPQMTPSHFRPTFKVISLDIETGMQGQLYSIGMHFTYGQQEKKIVLMVGELENSDIDYDLRFFSHEKQLLCEFLQLFGQLNPDIIIGWHVIGFDLKFLEKKCQEYKLKLSLGRGNEEIFIDSRKNGSWFARIPGRVVLDGPPVLRASFYSFESFKLDYVAHDLLGVGKDIQQSGKEKVAEIERRFREDKKSLAYYNLQDCVLVTQIFKKAQLIELYTQRTQISGMVFDRMGSSTGAFDYFFLPLLHRKGFVAPDTLDVELMEHSTGGHVLEPKVGLHQNVVVLDFKSLYPSIIRTFKIDPYSLASNDNEPIKTPPGVEFSSKEHILPGQIEKLMSLREQAKREGNAPLSQAIKILMNSFYGVMGSGGCRFYNRNLPTAITQTGHYILNKTVEYCEKSGFEVIYGDTDSLFVKVISKNTSKSVEQIAHNLAKEANSHLARHLMAQFGVESFLELEYEKHFLKFFLPSLRHSEGGAKKRYAGLLNKVGGAELYFAGLEVVRSDWTNMAKNFQRELFRRLFYDEDVEHWIKTFVDELKSGAFDEQLLYKKKLTKALEEYTKSHPPHVKAARLLQEQGMLNSREIEYFMTRRGPIPAELDHNDLDYNHYIEKQVRPLADMVLPILELSFAELIEGDQLTLF